MELGKIRLYEDGTKKDKRMRMELGGINDI